MDLNVMINNSLAKLKEEGFVENVVKTQLEKTIKSIVNDVLDSYSEFGKNLKEQVKEQLHINLDRLDIPSYNQLILATIKDHMNAVVHDQGVNRMKEQLDKLLLNAKEEYKLSELIKELAEEAEDLDELGYEETREMSLHIETPYSSIIHVYHVYLDSESDKDKHLCKYSIVIDAKTKEISSIRIREDKYSRSSKEFKEFDTRTIMGGFYGLEQTLFKMYARKSKLIIDEDAVDLELSNPEYD